MTRRPTPGCPNLSTRQVREIATPIPNIGHRPLANTPRFWPSQPLVGADPRVRSRPLAGFRARL